MSRCVWYVSKYVSLPSAGKGGIRAFMLMREIVRAGDEAVIITSDANHITNVPHVRGERLIQKVDGITVCWLRTQKYVGAKSLGRMLSWLDFEWKLWKTSKAEFPRPDAIIVSSLSLFTILNGLWLKWRLGGKLIFEVRDIWPLTIIEEGGFSRYNPFVIALGLIERLGYRHADAIVGTMPNLAEHVAGQVKRHPPVHCIPFGIDPDMVQDVEPLPADWVTKYIPEDKFVVCHAGTIGITNALDTLFDCARALKDDPRAQFVLVGEGDLRAHYERQCADLPNVTFTGPVPKKMVQSVLEHADLMYFSVHVSKVWKYGLSLNKIIDYMLSAKPVIGSYSGYRNPVEEAGSGSMVPSGDPVALKREILRYVEMSNDERKEIGQRGRQWLLTNWPYKKLAKDYKKLAFPD